MAPLSGVHGPGNLDTGDRGSSWWRKKLRDKMQLQIYLGQLSEEGGRGGGVPWACPYRIYSQKVILAPNLRPAFRKGLYPPLNERTLTMTYLWNVVIQNIAIRAEIPFSTHIEFNITIPTKRIKISQYFKNLKEKYHNLKKRFDNAYLWGITGITICSIKWQKWTNLWP